MSLLRSYDEMTPDQQLAYKMGYEAARSELCVAGRDDLRRGDSIPDALVDEAADAIDALGFDTLELRNWGDDSVANATELVARAALSVLFPGEEEE